MRWIVALLLLASIGSAQSADAREKPPLHWPNNRDVRRDETGCWKPPGDSFSQKEAWQAAGQPFADSLAANGQPLQRRDFLIDGFVKMRRGELAVVRVPGAGKEPTTAAFLVLTSGHKMLWKQELSQTPEWMPAEHYRLSRVVTHFDSRPLVLVFSDTGGSTRDFGYDLYRVDRSALAHVWAGDLDDGHSGSMQQGYAWSNFDFSKMSTGRANSFTVYTTSGFRRTMLPEDEGRPKTTYEKRTYRWNKNQGTFVKSSQSTLKRS